jgi:hypothetical protein
MFCVFFGLIFIAPLLLIMIALARIETPMVTAMNGTSLRSSSKAKAPDNIG